MQCQICNKEFKEIEHSNKSLELCKDCYWDQISEISDRVGFKPTPPPWRCTSWCLELLGPGEEKDIKEAFHKKTYGWPIGSTSFEFDKTTGWWIVKYWIDSSD